MVPSTMRIDGSRTRTQHILPLTPCPATHKCAPPQATLDLREKERRLNRLADRDEGEGSNTTRRTLVPVSVDGGLDGVGGSGGGEVGPGGARGCIEEV